MSKIEVSLETLLANDENWPLVRSMIKAELIPPDRMAEIARDYPAFWATVHSN